jgi:hypothetical protein
MYYRYDPRPARRARLQEKVMDARLRDMHEAEMKKWSENLKRRMRRTTQKGAAQ